MINIKFNDVETIICIVSNKNRFSNYQNYYEWTKSELLSGSSR